MDTVIFSDEINKDEFEREAMLYGESRCKVVLVNQLGILPRYNRNKTKLRKMSESFFSDDDYLKIDTAAFFMHGTTRELLGLGYNLWNCHKLARLISESTEKILIILYSCKCGRHVFPSRRRDRVKIGASSGWDGFAMRLSDAFALLNVDATIIAHTTRGHTTRNPSCVRITHEDGYIIRRDIVPYVSRRAARNNKIGRKRWLNWVDKLHNTLDFRFKFPFMSPEEILKEIS